MRAGGVCYHDNSKLRASIFTNWVCRCRYSFAVRTVSDWNQFAAVVVEQENPAAVKAQLARCAPARMP